MKTLFFSGAASAALFLTLSLSAANPPVPTLSVTLYPEGQDSDAGIVENGTEVTAGPGVSNGLSGDIVINEYGEYSNVNDQARLDIYLPENCNGQMIVDCPGGGYMFTAMINEGVNVASWCLENGIACCVVSYRMPNGHCTVPLTDVRNAFRYCRYHAAEWGIRQIGVMGFSAGGHLAGSAATMFEDELTRPDFAVLVYPVLTMDDAFTHTGTRHCLLGDELGGGITEYWSVENRVSALTPQTIIFLSDNDCCVPPENSLRYYRKMREYGVPCELHIFRDGDHGWGFTTLENSDHDNLGRQRPEFFTALGRWLSDRRAEIQ